jgi:hypothetical protein
MKSVKKVAATNPYDYDNFLKSHYITKDAEKPVTNTRIGDKNKEKKIYGGSYHIDESEYLSHFLPLYAEKVFGRGEPEYLTEKQLDKNGPIYVDLDFHFDYAVEYRILDKDYIDDLMDTYLDELKKIFQFDNEQSFQFFVMQNSQ